MIVLTLNGGSTSMKLAVYDTAIADAPVRLENEHRSGGDIDLPAQASQFVPDVRKFGELSI